MCLIPAVIKYIVCSLCYFSPFPNEGSATQILLPKYW